MILFFICTLASLLSLLTIPSVSSEGYFEFIQELVLFLTFLISFYKIFYYKKNISFYFLLNIFSMLIFMEETSYLQKYLGYASPEFFLKYNVKDQLNFHNMQFSIIPFIPIIFIMIFIIIQFKTKSGIVLLPHKAITISVFYLLLIKCSIWEYLGNEKCYDMYYFITQEHKELYSYIYLFTLSTQSVRCFHLLDIKRKFQIVGNKIALFLKEIGINQRFYN